MSYSGGFVTVANKGCLILRLNSTRLYLAWSTLLLELGNICKWSSCWTNKHRESGILKEKRMLRTVPFRYFSSSEEDFLGKHVDHIFGDFKFNLEEHWNICSNSLLSEHTSNNHEAVASKGPGTVSSTRRKQFCYSCNFWWRWWDFFALLWFCDMSCQSSPIAIASL